MKLNQLQPKAGSTANRIRVGRGIGSGKGKTAGKGTKGQKARTGVAVKGFEGGQMPLYRRLPKRGFKNIFSKKYGEITLGNLENALASKKLDAKKPVDHAALLESGILSPRTEGFRLIGGGVLKSKVEIVANGVTKSAQAAVEKVGGKITVLKPKVHETRGRAAKRQKKIKKVGDDE